MHVCVCVCVCVVYFCLCFELNRIWTRLLEILRVRLVVSYGFRALDFGLACATLLVSVNVMYFLVFLRVIFSEMSICMSFLQHHQWRAHGSIPAVLGPVNDTIPVASDVHLFLLRKRGSKERKGTMNQAPHIFCIL